MQFGELGFHLLVAQPKRRTSTAVDPVKLVFFRAVNDGEQIAADPVRDRFHQTERGVCGDRRVHRAAAPLQNIDADLRRRRHARANHSMSRQHFRPRCEILSGDAIDLGVTCVRSEEKSQRPDRVNQLRHSLSLVSCYQIGQIKADLRLASDTDALQFLE